jgi:large exoprotein involved in heme utilization and adhesion
VQVIGTAFNGQFVSGLGVETLGSGQGGDLMINTPHLLVSDGAGVSARTFSSGTGGDLTIKANESVQLESGFISVQAISGGTAGNLTIETQQMSVSEGSVVAVSSPGGQAGNLTITANSLILNQGTLTAETGTSGAEGGANITLNGLELLLMGNESLIDANALGKANGGNITIDSQFIVATSPVGSQGSDIVANAVEGNGGRVNITTQGIFGIEYQVSRTPENDITASSDYGVAGEVTISRPDVDPSRGLAELPTDLVDAEGQIDRRCTAGGKEPERNRFTVTGRGGLPPNPNETLQNQTVVTNWIEFDDKEPLESRERTEVETNANLSRVTQKAIVEAQGWVISTNGQVTLTANASTPTPHSSGLLPASCEDNQAAPH